MKKVNLDGTPYDGKLSRTVWCGGKEGDNIKLSPCATRSLITAA